MSISGQYPTPEIVNGYICWDCADVAKAKKGENPAASPLDPSSNGANGTNGSNGASGSSSTQGAQGASSQSPAVVFGGVLANASGPNASAFGQTLAGGTAAAQTSASLWAPGRQLNLTA